MNYALTEVQITQIIKICGDAVNHVPSILGTIGVAFLIIKQWLNNRDRKEGQEAIKGKIDENTELTKSLSPNQILLEQLQGARKTTNGHEIHTVVKLPGFDYEPFELSTGAVALWKQEPFEGGKRVRFSVTGAAEMRWHSHEVDEVLTGVKGVLIIDATDGTHMVGPGETFTSPAHAVHAVRFTAYGEIIADWIGQTSDELKIIIFNDAPKP
jgi:quercetin dioxygenase-like cupin family protein